MGKGRKPKPGKVHELSGAYKINPQRRNTTEPKPRDGEPVCPAEVKADPVAWEKWCEVVVTLDDMGILTIADGEVIADYCRTHSLVMRLWADIKTHGTSMVLETKYGTNIKRNPSCADYWAAESHFRQLMSELGLTPSGRARLHASKKPEDEDPLIGLLKVS